MKFLQTIGGLAFYQNDEYEIAEYGFSITVLDIPSLAEDDFIDISCVFSPKCTLAKFDTLESAVLWSIEHRKFYSSMKELLKACFNLVIELNYWDDRNRRHRVYVLATLKRLLIDLIAGCGENIDCDFLSKVYKLMDASKVNTLLEASNRYK